MKLFKKMGQFFSAATVGVGIATLFAPPLWPVTVGLAVAALFSFGVYKYKKYLHELEAAEQREDERYRAEMLKKNKEHKKRKLDELKKEWDAEIAEVKKENVEIKKENVDLRAGMSALTRRLDALESKAVPRRRHSFSFAPSLTVFKPQPLKRSSSFTEGLSTKMRDNKPRSWS